VTRERGYLGDTLKLLGGHRDQVLKNSFRGIGKREGIQGEESKGGPVNGSTSARKGRSSTWGGVERGGESEKGERRRENSSLRGLAVAVEIKIAPRGERGPSD